MYPSTQYMYSSAHYILFTCNFMKILYQILKIPHPQPHPQIFFGGVHTPPPPHPRGSMPGTVYHLSCTKHLVFCIMRQCTMYHTLNHVRRTCTLHLPPMYLASYTLRFVPCAIIPCTQHIEPCTMWQSCTLHSESSTLHQVPSTLSHYLPCT